MRKISAFILSSVLCVCLYAGDVAHFVDFGFSPDGRTFAFGQYGTDDKTFSAYGDIFFVDVAKNEFVPGANVSAAPSRIGGVQVPSTVFDELKNNASLTFKRLSLNAGLENATGGANAGRPLYAETSAVPLKDGHSMSFRDFETGENYDVSLHQVVSGEGAKSSSSFYITAKITDADGNTQTKTIGHPGYKRAGVLGYKINRIMTDKTGKALVFVVEKEVYSPGGNSIRYMVETLYR